MESGTNLNSIQNEDSQGQNELASLLPTSTSTFPSVSPSALSPVAAETAPSSPAPVSSQNSAPLSDQLRQFLKGNEYDTYAACKVIFDEVIRGVNVQPSLEAFAKEISEFDIDVKYPVEITDPSNWIMFPCCTYLVDTIRLERSKVVEEFLKKNTETVDEAEMFDTIEFNLFKLVKTHRIPYSHNSSFKNGSILDLKGVVLTRSTNVSRRVQDFIFKVFPRLCFPMSDIQKFHHHSSRCYEKEEGTVQLPEAIYTFVQNLVLDTLNLSDPLLSSSFPPTESEMKSEFFLSLGSTNNERSSRLVVLRCRRNMIAQKFLPSKITATLRELRYAEWIEDGGVAPRIKRRSHRKATKRAAPEE